MTPSRFLSAIAIVVAAGLSACAKPQPAIPAFDIVIRGGAIYDGTGAKPTVGDVNLAVNLNNVFDKKYCYSLFNSTFGNVYGEPRSVFVSLRARY
jgi:outer membrane receptor protein involved in Fe transport